MFCPIKFQIHFLPPSTLCNPLLHIIHLYYTKYLPPRMSNNHRVLNNKLFKNIMFKNKKYMIKSIIYAKQIAFYRKTITTITKSLH